MLEIKVLNLTYTYSPIQPLIHLVAQSHIPTHMHTLVHTINSRVEKTVVVCENLVCISNWSAQTKCHAV